MTIGKNWSYISILDTLCNRVQPRSPSFANDRSVARYSPFDYCMGGTEKPRKHGETRKIAFQRSSLSTPLASWMIGGLAHHLFLIFFNFFFGGSVVF